MSANSDQFALRPLLAALRSEHGDSEFGYRMQGMFAHVLVKLGANVLEVNAQGHPDIKARLAGDLLLIQVKSCEHPGASSAFQLSPNDFTGIASIEGVKGYLAFLDCADPVSWHVVSSIVARQFLNRCVPISALEIAREQQLSEDCSEVFRDIILGTKDRLGNLTFSLLSRRAIQGQQL